MIDGFLKLIDSNDALVQGESSDRKYPKLIEIYEFEFGDGVEGSGGLDLDAASGTAGDVTERLKRVQTLLGQIGDKDKKSGKSSHELAREALAQTNQAYDDVLKLRAALDSAADDPKREEERRKAREAAARAKEQGAKGKNRWLTFSIEKELDSASADLFQAHCVAEAFKDSQKHQSGVSAYRSLSQFKTAEVYLRKMFAGVPAPYLTLKFTHVEIQSYSLGTQSDGTGMKESVGFRFKDFSVTYTPQLATGAADTDKVVSGSVRGPEAGGGN
jgi:type VI protein secretion system component Hcp